jgi:putative tryptophan/tyrosine transport system substrate-binding protein
MRRRELLLLAVAMMGTRAARAQQKAMPVIGWLSTFSPPNDPRRSPFDQGLRETGYIEGENVAFESRWAYGHYDRFPAFAADLVSRKVDLILTHGGTPAALAAKNATSTIPILFLFVSDPVGIGLVASLARPGGNLTGFSNIAAGLMPKQLELLSELVPHAAAIGLLVNPNNPTAEAIIRELRDAADTKGAHLIVLKAGTVSEIDRAFASLAQLQIGGLIVDPDSFLSSRRDQLLALASRYAVPAIYGHPPFVADGGLIGYGIDQTPVFREAGIYAGRILKGTKPADLPVQQPAIFKLSVNLTTAKALGITVPPPILARADEVIE